MNEVVLRKLLTKRLMALDANFPTEREAVDFTPTEGVAYQSVYLLKGETQNPTMGDGYNMPVGIFQITLAYPFGKGTADLDAKVNAIKTQFPRGWSATEGSGTVHVIRTPYAGPGFRDAGFWKVPVTVPYVAQSFNS